eukprot:scaffold13772_cov83-Skeletonema_menzelii.AAC.1
MTLFYFGPAWNPSGKDTLQVILQNGELFFQFSSNTGKFQLAKKKLLADDQWHHIASLCPSISIAATGRLNVGGYGYRNDPNNGDGFARTFEGEIDDVMVWSKPLQEQDILELWVWDPTLNSEPRDDYKTISCGRGDGSSRCAEGDRDRDVAPIDEIHA